MSNLFVLDGAPPMGQVGFTVGPGLAVRQTDVAPNRRSQQRHLMLHWHRRQMRLQRGEWN